MESDFEAIPEIARSDAQVDLLFLLNSDVQYVHPVTDPWFEANKLYTGSVGLVDDNGDVNVTLYGTPGPVNILGCASQWTWCNPQSTATPNGLCTKPADSNWASHYAKEKDLHFSSEQLEVLDRMDFAFANNWLSNTANNIGNKVLLASQKVFGNVGDTLPDNQWIQELDHFFAITMVASQYHLSQYPRGNGYPTPDQHILAPTETQSWMCANQVIQRDGYTSFRMIGVIVILVVGG